MKVQGHSHTRINTGVLAAAEKRALIWIAERLPSWVNSDHLTLLALAAMAGAGAAFWASRYWPPALAFVVVALALNWFGDSLDGTVARVRKHERPHYGFYVDHVLDVTGFSLLAGGMSLSGFISPIVGLTLLAAYLLVSAEVFLATAVNRQFRMSFLRVGPTELRIILAIGILRLFFSPTVSPFGFGPFLLFDVGAAFGIAGLMLALLTSVIRTTAALYRAEPLPAQPERPALTSLARQSNVVPIAALAFATLVPAATHAATLQPHTQRAWDAYTAATEARIARELASTRGFLITDFSPEAIKTRMCIAKGQVAIGEMTTADRAGNTIEVADGLISHWRGSVFLPGVGLDTLLDRLQHPSEQGPHQVDVLALRVLERRPEQLKLFIRMTRTKIVTVTYDTEHRLDYRRHSPTRASSRSVATKIVELEGAGTAIERGKPSGQDRGFLWRLNSYWRYEAVDGGVIVELESLTLSRSVPLGLGGVVDPIIDTIARESIGRTIENIRRTYAWSAASKRVAS